MELIQAYHNAITQKKLDLIQFVIREIKSIVCEVEQGYLTWDLREQAEKKVHEMLCRNKLEHQMLVIIEMEDKLSFRVAYVETIEGVKEDFTGVFTNYEHAERTGYIPKYGYAKECGMERIK